MVSIFFLDLCPNLSFDGCLLLIFYWYLWDILILTIMGEYNYYSKINALFNSLIFLYLWKLYHFCGTPDVTVDFLIVEYVFLYFVQAIMELVGHP